MFHAQASSENKVLADIASPPNLFIRSPSVFSARNSHEENIQGVLLLPLPLMRLSNGDLLHSLGFRDNYKPILGAGCLKAVT